jgi:hypothetical protein
MIGGKRSRSRTRPRTRSKSRSRVKRSKGSKRRRRHSKRTGKKSRKSKRASTPWIVFLKKVHKEGVRAHGKDNYSFSRAMKDAAKDPRWLKRK